MVVALQMQDSWSSCRNTFTSYGQRCQPHWHGIDLMERDLRLTSSVVNRKPTGSRDPGITKTKEILPASSYRTSYRWKQS